MFQNMLMTAFTPLHSIDEQYHWENRPFVGIWPEGTVQAKSSITKTKRRRTYFTTKQQTLLEKEFANDKYVRKERRQELSQLMNISEKTIKVWFQNRRMKYKAEVGLVTPPKSPNEIAKEQIAKESASSEPKEDCLGSDSLQEESQIKQTDETLLLDNVSSSVPQPQVDHQISNNLDRNTLSYNNYSHYYNTNVYYNTWGKSPYYNYYSAYSESSQWTHNEIPNNDLDYINL